MSVEAVGGAAVAAATTMTSTATAALVIQPTLQYVALAGLAPVVATLVPLLVFRNGLPARTVRLFLALSAGACHRCSSLALVRSSLALITFVCSIFLAFLARSQLSQRPCCLETSEETARASAALAFEETLLRRCPWSRRSAGV
jgi:hypothetical protein